MTQSTVTDTADAVILCKTTRGTGHQIVEKLVITLKWRGLTGPEGGLVREKRKGDRTVLSHIYNLGHHVFGSEEGASTEGTRRRTALAGGD